MKLCISFLTVAALVKCVISYTFFPTHAVRLEKSIPEDIVQITSKLKTSPLCYGGYF